ncbi:MAG: hotdog fold thioesterase [Desulfuromonadales bacterium]|nr:hotdog fold thioesterase [Desulfuromonadales bacterium]
MLWSRHYTLAELNAVTAGNLAGHLGMEFTEIGPDFLRARMPVDERTIQPAGLLHGGASVALAETLGSVAANLVKNREGFMGGCVGLEINANHLRPVRSGWVVGETRPVHLGQRTQVWEIRITDERDRLVCISRLTIAVVGRGAETKIAG